MASYKTTKSYSASHGGQVPKVPVPSSNYRDIEGATPKYSDKAKEEAAKFMKASRALSEKTKASTSGLAKFQQAKEKLKEVKATELNRSALFEHMNGADRAPNQIRPVDAPHLRRAMKAGLVKVEGKELVLTEEGKAAQAEHEQKEAPRALEAAKRHVEDAERILSKAKENGDAGRVSEAESLLAKQKQKLARAEERHGHLEKSSVDKRIASVEAGGHKAPEHGWGPRSLAKAEEASGKKEESHDDKLYRLTQAHTDAYMRASHANTPEEREQGKKDMARYKKEISDHITAGESKKKEKGGEQSLETGKRGGRYYVNASGTKVYV